MGDDAPPGSDEAHQVELMGSEGALEGRDCHVGGANTDRQTLSHVYGEGVFKQGCHVGGGRTSHLGKVVNERFRDAKECAQV
jgi:hypothetical protein